MIWRIADSIEDKEITITFPKEGSSYMLGEEGTLDRLCAFLSVLGIVVTRPQARPAGLAIAEFISHEQDLRDAVQAWPEFQFHTIEYEFPSRD